MHLGLILFIEQSYQIYCGLYKLRLVTYFLNVYSCYY